MKFSLEGRIANLQLPGGAAPIFLSIEEAVSNSVHAIQERFGDDGIGKHGTIDIFVETDSFSPNGEHNTDF